MSHLDVLIGPGESTQVDQCTDAAKLLHTPHVT